MTDFDALIDKVKDAMYGHGYGVEVYSASCALREAVNAVISRLAIAEDANARLTKIGDELIDAKARVASIEAELKTEAQETYRLMKELESAQADRNIAQASLDDVTEQLKEADADAERLWREDPFVEDHTGGDYCVYCGGRKHDDDCPHVLHVARLSKRGQGKEEGKG